MPIDVSLPVAQAYVWILTQNATFAAMQRLRLTVNQSSGTYDNLVISESDAARALRYLDRAGLDVTRLEIWKDRAALSAKVTSDIELASWLQRP
jgi:hypothetical protein